MTFITVLKQVWANVVGCLVVGPRESGCWLELLSWRCRSFSVHSIFRIRMSWHSMSSGCRTSRVGFSAVSRSPDGGPSTVSLLLLMQRLVPYSHPILGPLSYRREVLDGVIGLRRCNFRDGPATVVLVREWPRRSAFVSLLRLQTLC